MCLSSQTDETMVGTTVETGTGTTATTGEEMTATGTETDENLAVMIDETLQEEMQTENVTVATVQVTVAWRVLTGPKGEANLRVATMEIGII